MLQFHRLAETLGEWKTKNLKPSVDRNYKLCFYLGLVPLNYVSGARQHLLLKKKTENKIGVEKLVICIHFIIFLHVNLNWYFVTLLKGKRGLPGDPQVILDGWKSRKEMAETTRAPNGILPKDAPKGKCGAYGLRGEVLEVWIDGAIPGIVVL